MSRAISKRLLVCAATACRADGTDADRNPQWSDPVELKKVWITRTLAQGRGTAGVQAADTMTLFFDCENSEPSGFVPERNMRITYGGTDYYVESVTPCPCPAGIHHYEATLK